MERRNFAQILKEADIDIKREYNRLYSAFYVQKSADVNGNYFSLKEYCEANFINLPFRGTCMSLDDFEDFYKIHYEKVPSNFDLNYLISFCEYTYNLAIYLSSPAPFGYMSMMPPNQMYLNQIVKVIDAIGYKSVQKDSVTIFVPTSAAAISVAEIVSPELSYKVIEYNHHTLYGNIEGKKNILLLLAGKLESQRKQLKQINKTMEDNLFFLFNNLNLRHNNCDKESKDYNAFIEEMPKKDLESWYDDTYQLCLLAFLELDNVERTRKIKDLRKSLKENG